MKLSLEPIKLNLQQQTCRWLSKCQECGETFDARICAYLTIRPEHLSVQDGTVRRFSATQNTASVQYAQSLRTLEMCLPSANA